MSEDKTTEPSDGFTELLCSSKQYVCECPLDLLLLTFAAVVLFTVVAEKFKSIRESGGEVRRLSSAVSQPI